MRFIILASAMLISATICMVNGHKLIELPSEIMILVVIAGGIAGILDIMDLGCKRDGTRK